MNISVYLPHSEDPITYANVNFSTGFTLMPKENQPEFHDTGELWIFRMVEDQQSKKLLRYNIAVFPRGCWLRVEFEQPKEQVH